MLRYIFIIALSYFNAISCIAAPIDERSIDEIISRDITATFKDQRENTFQNNALLRVAISMFLQTREAAFYEPSLGFVSGCRIHSCEEKAMAAINLDRKYLAGVAILSFNCRLTANDHLSNNSEDKKIDPLINHCDHQPTLKIFLIRRKKFIDAITLEPAILQKFRQWGQKSSYKNEEVQVWENDQ
jgi:hypothetical protein